MSIRGSGAGPRSNGTLNCRIARSTRLSNFWGTPINSPEGTMWSSHIMPEVVDCGLSLN